MPLTDIQIRNAKPGLKPIRPGKLAKRKNSQSAVTSTNGTASNSGAERLEKTDKPYRLADANGLYLEVAPPEESIGDLSIASEVRRSGFPLESIRQLALRMHEGRETNTENNWQRE